MLFLLAEDGLADTVRPAIERMGGDLTRVFVLEGTVEGGTTRMINLARDLATVEAAIAEIKSPRSSSSIRSRPISVKRTATRTLKSEGC